MINRSTPAQAATAPGAAMRQACASNALETAGHAGKGFRLWEAAAPARLAAWPKVPVARPRTGTSVLRGRRARVASSPQFAFGAIAGGSRPFCADLGAERAA